MRKIISKKDEGKRKKRNQVLAGGVLILIMFISVIGYSALNNTNQNDSEKIVYNGIEFTKESGLWNAGIGNFQFYFNYNPQEVEEIDSKLNSLEDYYEKPLYIYSENSEAEIEIYRNLFYYNQIVQRSQSACLEEDKENCGVDIPIKNCEDKFIIIKESENTEIRQEDNCVFIEGKNEDLIKLSDSFLFNIIGV